MKPRVCVTLIRSILTVCFILPTLLQEPTRTISSFIIASHIDFMMPSTTSQKPHPLIPPNNQSHRHITYSEGILVGSFPHLPFNAVSYRREVQIHHQAQVSPPPETVRVLKRTEGLIRLSSVVGLCQENGGFQKIINLIYIRTYMYYTHAMCSQVHFL